MGKPHEFIPLVPFRVMPVFSETFGKTVIEKENSASADHHGHRYEIPKTYTLKNFKNAAKCLLYLFI